MAPAATASVSGRALVLAGRPLARADGADPARAQRAAPPVVRQAVELGITVWDTANGYQGGSSEEMVGRAVRRFSRRWEQVRGCLPGPPALSPGTRPDYPRGPEPASADRPSGSGAPGEVGP